MRTAPRPRWIIFLLARYPRDLSFAVTFMYPSVGCSRDMRTISASTRHLLLAMGFDQELLQLRILPLGLALPLPLLDAHAAALASPAAEAMGANFAFLAFALHPNARVGLAEDADCLLGGASYLLHR
ncbi:MAG: hypothetical protein MKZ70_10145 [Opitutales bacterium]|nr:hypothetical protein [Opitutales bacterium]